jgi:hypothetical protein
MGTNRYHFSLIPAEYQIKYVETKYQYFIKHEDIVKHVNFKKLREEKGSIFAFHGSPQENWHSILRSGLQIGKGGYLVNTLFYLFDLFIFILFVVKWCSIWRRNLCFTEYGIFIIIYTFSSVV